MIEEQLDVALSKTCSNFDVVHYEKVQKAYKLLNKTQVCYLLNSIKIPISNCTLFYTYFVQTSFKCDNSSLIITEKA